MTSASSGSPATFGTTNSATRIELAGARSVQAAGLEKLNVPAWAAGTASRRAMRRPEDMGTIVVERLWLFQNCGARRVRHPWSRSASRLERRGDDTTTRRLLRWRLRRPARRITKLREITKKSERSSTDCDPLTAPRRRRGGRTYDSG